MTQPSEEAFEGWWNKNLWQDEAKDAARAAWQQGYERALDAALKEAHMLRMEKFVAASRETDTHEQAFLEVEQKMAEKVWAAIRSLKREVKDAS